MNDFGEPELLDDIVDHWSSSIHVAEKAKLLTHLRNLARETRTRITLLSGDVHQCIFCFTSSDADWANLAADPGYMPQARARLPRLHLCLQLYAQPTHGQ